LSDFGVDFGLLERPKGGVDALFFGAVLVVVLTALALRSLRRGSIRRQWLSLPAHSPQSAAHLDGFTQLDAWVGDAKCFCGGALRRLSEGSRTDLGITMRVVQTECSRCEESTALYFVVDAIQH